jgi:glucose/arabinose dehydrogenase
MIEPIDIVMFRRNREQFPDEQLERYWGKQVAWSADGTHIVAWGDDHKQLYERLAALGIHPTVVVDEFIPDPNVSYL